MSVNTVISLLTSLADNVGAWITAKRELQAIADSVHKLADVIDDIVDNMDDDDDDDDEKR